jgi:multisubunit Na+/H+ antiporter MnhE subunit
MTVIEGKASVSLCTISRRPLKDKQQRSVHIFKPNHKRCYLPLAASVIMKGLIVSFCASVRFSVLSKGIPKNEDCSPIRLAVAWRLNERYETSLMASMIRLAPSTSSPEQVPDGQELD